MRVGRSSTLSRRKLQNSRKNFKKELQPENDKAAVLYAKRIKTQAQVQNIRPRAANTYSKCMQTRWAEKVLHGRNPTQIKEADVDMKATNQSPNFCKPP